ncbi:DUF4845 domain-containing protein [Thalassolituus sp.]|jgi:hypothetical protein|uniref:DUF4845 domain-containing protein n=1 Tax=Thalassolituus sp. TaxID=2030822 RepID=UPI00262C7F91|nr:DUF4845 domain-containing protein [uncultured Thalassolituus sp.]TNC92419.1 MAG: hypothetical protein CSH36_04670 [Thalassolituus sp.]
MKTQQGMSSVTFLSLILVGVILLRGLLVIVPIYFDDMEVGIILDNLEESGKVGNTTSVRDVRAELARRLSSNDIRVSVDGVVITRERGGVVLDWTYENRGHFLGNIDVVLTFHQRKEFTK